MGYDACTIKGRKWVEILCHIYKHNLITSEKGSLIQQDMGAQWYV